MCPQHQMVIDRLVIPMKQQKKNVVRLQTTQHTRDGALTEVLARCWAIVSKPPAPSNVGPIYHFWPSRSCGTGEWLTLLLIKSGDVETNPGLTTTHKQAWICDICHKQIHGRKQISIRCNMIKHWVQAST